MKPSNVFIDNIEKDSEEDYKVVLDDTNSVIVDSDKYNFVVLSSVVNVLWSLSKNCLIQNLHYKVSDDYTKVIISYVKDSNSCRKEFVFYDFRMGLTCEPSTRMNRVQVSIEVTKTIKSLLEIP